MRAVLICDGDERRRAQLTCWLGQEGYQAESSTTAADALRKLAERRYDCLILDLLLPGISGLDVLPVIRAHYPRLPVIAVVAENSFELERRARMERVFYYLVKPIDREEMRAVLQSAIAPATSHRRE